MHIDVRVRQFIEVVPVLAPAAVARKIVENGAFPMPRMKRSTKVGVNLHLMIVVSIFRLSVDPVLLLACGKIRQNVGTLTSCRVIL